MVGWANPDFADSLKPSQNVLYSFIHHSIPSPYIAMSLFTRFARGSASKSLARSYATTVSEASGVKVAGYERGAPAGTVNLTVVVKAGSRYETRPGVAHVLKNFAFKVGSILHCVVGDEPVESRWSDDAQLTGASMELSLTYSRRRTDPP